MINFERLRPYFLKPDINERVIAARLINIKKIYTTHRDQLFLKKWDEFDVSSYTAFYLSTNYQKFTFIKDELPANFFKEIDEVIDFGTGPGTYALAYLDHIANPNTRIYAIDNNKLMLEQAKKLLNGLHPEHSSQLNFLENADEIPLKKGRRLLIFGNSINELGFDLTWKLIKKIDCDQLLFIEPGTSEVFKQVLKLRNTLITEGFYCHYPCINGGKPCPLVGLKNDWCHQVWRGSHDESIERLGQMAKLDRKIMPFIGHAYVKMSKSEDQNSYRVVRFLRETKFSFEWQVCGIFNGVNNLKDFEIMKKTLSKKQVKELKRQSVGVKFKVKKIKEMTPQKWRVELIN